MSVLLAIIGLGVLVVVHEAGHYLVARWSNMRVERFSIGFGPPVLKWKQGETQFQLAPIPFGGFVQIVGMNPHEEFDERDPRVYPNRPALARFLTILAGPGMNYVFSVVLMFVVYAIAGAESGTEYWRVGGVHQGAPAAGQLQTDDLIVAVNGERLYKQVGGAAQVSFPEMVQKTGEAPIQLTVLRDGKEVDVTVTPRRLPATEQGEAIDQVLALNGQEIAPRPYRIGIDLSYVPERRAIGLGEAAKGAAIYPVDMTDRIVDGLVKIVKREVPAEVTGPVGIVDAMEEQFTLGWVRAFEVLAMLNVYLGLFNLLPIPGLDGGRLAFLTYELATRRRPNPKVEAAVHMFGFLVLFLIIILVTFKDIRNLFL